MPKCYSYIRFSRPEQMRGDSLRRQMEAAERWAAEHGMVVDESLTDLGVSAFRGLNRLKGALGGFLDLVSKGQVPKGSFLIIESLDRFSREDALDVLGEFTKVLKAGITIVTLIDRQPYSLERIRAEAAVGVAVEMDVAAVHAWPDAMRIMRAEYPDCPVRVLDEDAGDIDDRPVPRHPFPNAVVVAADQKAPAVQPCENLPGAGLRTAIEDIPEVPDGVLRAHGRVPVGDQRLVVLLDGGEGAVQAEARAERGTVVPVAVRGKEDPVRW